MPRKNGQGVVGSGKNMEGQGRGGGDGRRRLAEGGGRWEGREVGKRGGNEGGCNERGFGGLTGEIEGQRSEGGEARK